MKTRYRIEIEVEAEGDLLAQDIAPDLTQLAARFSDAKLSVVVTSLHLCPQCKQWHGEGRGPLTYVRDYDMWCPVCRSLVSATPGEPQRGLFSTAGLQLPPKGEPCPS